MLGVGFLPGLSSAMSWSASTSHLCFSDMPFRIDFTGRNWMCLCLCDAPDATTGISEIRCTFKHSPHLQS